MRFSLKLIVVTGSAALTLLVCAIFFLDPEATDAPATGFVDTTDLPKAGEFRQDNASPQRSLQTSQQAESIQILILGEGGHPIPTAKLEVHSDNAPLKHYTTGLDGISYIEPSTRDLWMAINANGYLRTYRLLDHSEPYQVFSLDTGGTLTGVIQIHGKGNIQSSFSFDVIGHGQLPNNVPRQLFSRLGADTTKIPVQANGHFQLLGVPLEWQSVARIPKPYLACGENDPSTIANLGQTIRGLKINNYQVITLHKMPWVRGKLVSSTTGSPVPFQTLQMALEFENGAYEWLGAKSKDDGSFEIPFVPHQDQDYRSACEPGYERGPNSVDIEVVQGNELGNSQFSIDLRTKIDRWNFGTIELENQEILKFHVQDEGGNPVQGAVASNINVSLPTGTNGNSSLMLGDFERPILIGAPGYEISEFPVPVDLSQTLIVTLQPSATLTIQIKAKDGICLEGLDLQIQADGRVFPKEINFRHLQSISSPPKSGKSNSNGHEIKYWALEPDTKSIFLPFISTGVRLQLGITGALGRPLAVSNPFTINPGEQKVVNLDIQTPPRILLGKVVDSYGMPVPDAKIKLITNSPSFWPTTTDDGGLFQFPPLGATECTISVRKDGYALFQDEGFQIPATSEPIIISLDMARELSLFVTDENGNHLEDVVLFYGKADGGMFATSPVATGNPYQISAPPGEFELSWMAGGLVGSINIPAKINEYDLELPALGYLRATFFRTDTTESAGYRFNLVPHEASNQSFNGLHNLYFDGTTTQIVKDQISILPGKYTVSAWPYLGHGIEPPTAQKLGEISIESGKTLEMEFHLIAFPH